MERVGRLSSSLVVSLLLHLSFVYLFFAGSFGVREAPLPPLSIELYDADEKRRERARAVPDAAPAAPAAPAEAPPESPETASRPPPKNQIVSPPDSPEAEPPPDTRLLSERNSKALVEMLKRGQPAPPAEPPRESASRGKRGRPEAPPPREAPKERARSEPKSEKPLPGLADLFAKPEDLIRDRAFVDGADGLGDEGAGRGSSDQLASARRPNLWADPGERGTPDYLPDVRNGEFTLLNTKADLFAPFVRRVGLRVFQTFSMDFKRMIQNGQVPQGKEMIEIEAVMSPDGRRIEIELKNRSGNLSTDRVMLGLPLSDHIFFDENPPRGAAAADGRIHFVFALDASVWYRETEHGRQPGAHWIFAAGLL